MMKKYIFIHAPNLPKTQESLNVILDRISNSNLIYDHMYICESNGISVDSKGLGNCTHIKTMHDYDKFEYPTLEFIHSLAKKEEFYALYLHAKGASKINHEEFENALNWADYMLYGVVDNHELCISHLDRGADLVGSQWHWHFKGNFWWANSNHLKKMPPPMELGPERFNAEYWCCFGLWHPALDIPKVKNLFYIPDMQDDSKYTLLKSALPIESISLDNIIAFVDKRIDPSQPWNLKEFLNLNYKCALGSVYVLNSDKNLFSELIKYLNYDSDITIVYDEVYETFSYDQFCAKLSD